MRSRHGLAATLLLLLGTLATAPPVGGRTGADGLPFSGIPRIEEAAATRPIVSSGVGDLARSASPDTLFVYGGSASPQGTFENPVTGQPDWQGWFGVDRTLKPNHWHRSTFNAATLGGHGPGNVALWCGASAEQEPGWGSPPGYGNSWNDAVVFETPMIDPSVAQDVELSFFFHHESEPGYDYFSVEHDSAGVWIPTLRLDRTDADPVTGFAAPGVSYAEVATGLIRFGGNDYGAEGDVLRIRLHFRSDGAWSDEDGFFPTDAGAVQVDDVLVRWDDGTGTAQEDFEDFEDEESAWAVAFPPFAGDFAELHPDVQDLDPCVEAGGSVVGFIDFGQQPCPEPLHPYCIIGTGGTPGSGEYPWVVNHDGGLSMGLTPVANDVWSPEIAWDLPTPDDDGPEWSGARLGFDVYTDLPLTNGIFYVWALRSSPDGEVWSRWKDHRSVYWNSSRREWIRVEEDVSDALAETRRLGLPIHTVQISLGVRDYADLFGLPGNSATISPFFDDVALAKYRLRGPQFRVRERDLATDAFPEGGTLDTTDLGELDVRFDMAWDVGQRYGVVDPGDSVVVGVEAIIPGSAVTEVRMRWVLDKNPLFDDSLRQIPVGPEHVNVNASDPARWTGDVIGDGWIRDRWAFDLPDQDFLYPGDVLRYRFLAFDDQGRVSGLPVEETGLLDGVDYDPRFVMHALPALRPEPFAGIVQAPNLFVLNTGRWRDGRLLRVSLRTLGLEEGLDYDVFTVREPERTPTASLGSAAGAGASLEQIAGYRNLFLDFGPRRHDLLGDGSFGSPVTDLQLLAGWHDLDGDRAAVHFGTNLASFLANGSSLALTYLQSYLGATLGSEDVRPSQSVRRLEQVLPPAPDTAPVFQRRYVLVPSCGIDGDFDALVPLNFLPGSIGAHSFAGIPPQEEGYVSVFYRRYVGVDRKVGLTFSFPLSDLQSIQLKAPGPYTTQAWLLSEIFAYLREPTAAPPTGPRVPLALTVHPSPFNPVTTVELSLPSAGAARVEVFDLRGRRVRTLFVGELPRPGLHALRWDGRDDRGSTLASGIYVVRAEVEGHVLTRKVSVLK